MDENSKPRKTIYGTSPEDRQVVRYRLPTGLIEQVFREAQRSGISTSSVAELALTLGLPGVSVVTVTARLRESASGLHLQPEETDG